MHSINNSVSFHSRPNSGLLFSVDNSKKLPGKYMDYLVEYSFYFFLKMARACKIRCFVFIAAHTNSNTFLNSYCFVCNYNKYSFSVAYICKFTYSFAYKQTLANRIEEGVQKG